MRRHRFALWVMIPFLSSLGMCDCRAATPEEDFLEAYYTHELDGEWVPSVAHRSKAWGEFIKRERWLLSKRCGAGPAEEGEG